MFPDEEYDRAAACFPEGAPDVAVAWATVERATLTPLHNDKGDSEDQEPSIHWHVYGFPGCDGDHNLTQFVVYGDLSLSANGWFLGVTAAVGLGFRDGTLPIDPDDAEQVNDLSRTLGSWASTLLYDLAAASGRILTASNLACNVKLPELTPKPHFPHLSQASSEALDS